MICILLKSDIVFEINILSILTSSCCIMLGLCYFHQQVDTCQSTRVELFLQILVFLLGSYCHYGLSIWRNSSSFEAQGMVNLPRAAPEGVKSCGSGRWWEVHLDYKISSGPSLTMNFEFDKDQDQNRSLTIFWPNQVLHMSGL